MIHCDKGVVEVDGNRSQLLAELGSIMRGMLLEGIANKRDLYEAIDYASMNDDELHDRAKEMERELIGKMILDMILSDIVQEEANQSEQSGERTKQAEDMLNIIKEVKRRKK